MPCRFAWERSLNQCRTSHSKEGDATFEQMAVAHEPESLLFREDRVSTKAAELREGSYLAVEAEEVDG
eukprot:786023-Rhodomonas_salina.1